MKKLKITLTTEEATLVAATLIFAASPDFCGQWDASYGKKFIKITKKLSEAGITDVSKLISIIDDPKHFEDPKLVKKVRRKFKLDES